MLVAMIATVTVSAQHIVESGAFDNTYTSVSVGGTVRTPLINGIGDIDETKPIFGIEFGKDLTTLYGMSFEGKTTVNNKGIHTAFDDFSVVWNHKLNLTNAIWGYNPDRKWEVKAVGGLGWGHDNGCVVDNYLVAEAGAEVLYNFNDKWGLNINPTFVWDGAEGGLNANKSEIELSVGVVYKFNKRGFTVCDRDFLVEECNNLNAKINELREIVNDRDASLAANKEVIEQKNAEIAELKSKDMVIVKNVVPSVIGFEIGKSVILPTNDGSLINLANFLKEHNDLKIEVVGYADAQTGTHEINQRLSEERALAIKNALVELGVDGERISTVGKGDTEQLFDKNDANRAVITVIR